MSALPPGELIWSPAPDARATTRLGHYMDWLEGERGLRFDDYAALWSWSVEEVGPFWQSIWDYFEVISHAEPGPALAAERMPGAEWFPGARLNYAEHALRHDGDDDVVIAARSQTRDDISLTRAELREEVARVRRGLQRLGVGRGDRVAGYLPNVPEAVIALLATASLGAIWAACPPEFGTQSVLDRLAQVDPKVLLVIDGYRYGTKSIDRVDDVAAVRAALPGLEATVAIPYLEPRRERIPDAVSWAMLRSESGPLEFDPVPFDHPLWILFSSGTTGLPKAIVHGHGGIVLEHLKIGGLMQDMGRGDRYFFFSTTAWMVWNRVVSSLLVGAGMTLLDGDPGYPHAGSLLDVVAETGVTVWGVGTPYLMMCREAGVVPRERDDLGRLRQVVAAGSAVPPEGYRYVADAFPAGLHFYTGSGGTDVCTGFVSGTPLSPVTIGEIPARMPGVAVEAFDAEGHAVIDEVGEMVITKPMPSMPVGLWGDEDGERYRSTYFDRFPGVWHHGDLFVVSSRGTCNVIGRSDATLNRGGVRLGTAEFYPVLEALDEVEDSLVIHLEDTMGARGSLILFVVLADDAELDDDLRRRFAAELRGKRSPRHVPDEVHAVPAIPRTLSGKKLEVPVKRIMLGEPAEAVAAPGSLQDPTAIDAFIELAAARLIGPPAGR
jgi:acetoacetyl-CoA synthetase